MHSILWIRALWLSLGVISASTLANLGVSYLLPVPSVSFDIGVAVVDILIAAGASWWYLQEESLKRSWSSGFNFGVVLLAMQFMLGIGMGMVYEPYTITPVELSANPLIMFISIIVFTLSTTSAVGGLVSSKK